MRRAALRALLPALALALTALVTPGTAAASSSTTQVALAAEVAPTSAHPYSDPVFWPLRTTAQITCVYSNCPGTYHGYWAMDLDGDLGDPIYAAGAGVFHVGAVDPGCKASVNDEGGTWAWIDHGSGRVSRYHHLDSIVATEGQFVTPSTVIGRMGHSGDVSPCLTNYLHFEVRDGGVKGTRINPGSLLACVSGAQQTWPAALGGYSSWNSLTRGAVHTPTSTTCPSTPWTTTPNLPSPLTGSRGDGAVRLYWPKAPAGSNRVMLAVETYHPSVPEWGAPAYRAMTATTTTTVVSNLQNGRPYRFRVAYHNGSGSSAWSGYRYFTPAARPSAPRVARWLTATTSKIRYAWWKAAEHGTPVTSYTVAVRGYSSAGWSRWHYSTVSSGVYNYNWTTVTRGRLYQVTVRANSAVGSSAFATRKYIRVPR